MPQVNPSPSPVLYYNTGYGHKAYSIEESVYIACEDIHDTLEFLGNLVAQLHSQGLLLSPALCRILGPRWSMGMGGAEAAHLEALTMKDPAP